jgi:integrase
MTPSTGKYRKHFKSTRPTDPQITPFGEWLPENRHFHADFCCWLKQGGYGASAIHIYCVGARLALGLLDKPIEGIDIEHDFQSVLAHLETRPLASATVDGYRKGLNKLAQYLRLQRGVPEPDKIVNWSSSLGEIPVWLAEPLRTYADQRSRGWRSDIRVQYTRDLLSRLCGFARAAQPASPQDISPRSWFAYLSRRVQAGAKPASNNLALRSLQSFLRFVQDKGRPIDLRMLKVRRQKTGNRSPRDVPVPDLKVILKATTGPFDRAWLLLMLHAGLRTIEIRRLKWSSLDFAGRMIRIEGSKNLKSRVVFMTRPVTDALQGLSMNSEFVFSLYHRPLSRGYCQSRLRTSGRACGVKISPHQLRHSAATLLLNAGMSIWGVKEILGHKYVDTTLGYARMYDSKVTADYYQAIKKVEL